MKALAKWLAQPHNATVSVVSRVVTVKERHVPQIRAALAAHVWLRLMESLEHLRVHVKTDFQVHVAKKLHVQQIRVKIKEHVP